MRKIVVNGLFFRGDLVGYRFDIIDGGSRVVSVDIDEKLFTDLCNSINSKIGCGMSKGSKIKLKIVENLLVSDNESNVISCKDVSSAFDTIKGYIFKDSGGMSISAFWDLMDEMHNECGGDQDNSVRWLRNRLCRMDSGDVFEFDCIFRAYHRFANRFGLWSVASVIKYGCSDDGFAYFRSWLISQGREVYTSTLENPDYLAKLDTDEYCSFEELAYVVGDYIGGYDYERAKDKVQGYLKEIQGSINVGEYVKYPVDEYYIKAFYPNIYNKFLSHRKVDPDVSYWNFYGEEARLYKEGKVLAEKFLKSNR